MIGCLVQHFLWLAALTGIVSATTNPYAAVYKERSSATPTNNGLEVDLGYAIYTGTSDPTSTLNTWLGIRFAAAPTGSLRFSAPVVPAVNRTPQSANAAPTQCPQCGPSGSSPLGVLGAALLAQSQAPSNEDCLFLNVYAPPNATNLPVFVWIYGGGYEGGGAMNYNPTIMMNTNGNSFVSVIIQYRLGAFGFLSSSTVKKYGSLNAGLLDQHLALYWVQQYISLFGGSPTHVTIAGESAGAGSVMNHIVSYGGSLGTTLFRNAITASPFLPGQHVYNDTEPKGYYNTFVQQAGCGNITNNALVFKCLQAADSTVLKNANVATAKQDLYGLFAFRPVTDGVFLQSTPLEALTAGKINGLNILSGNNADEGYLFTPQNITTADLFLDFLEQYYPLLTSSQLKQIISAYHTPDVTDIPNAALYATPGDYGSSTALNQSILGTGHQQQANNFYSEATFVCASYYLVQAFTAKSGHSAYQYQYSVPAAFHAADVLNYFPPNGLQILPGEVASLRSAFQQAYGTFITKEKPSVVETTTRLGSSWPKYTCSKPYMQNLNISGGLPSPEPLGPTLIPIVNDGPTVALNFSVVNANTWEGGRGARCELLKSFRKQMML